MNDARLSAPLADERLEQLSSLLQRKGADAAFLDGILDLTIERLQADSLALYELVGCELARIGRRGGDEWPASLTLDRDQEDAAVSRCLIQGGELHWRGGRSDLDAPSRLLLEVASRLCQYQRRLKQREFDVKFRGVELEAFYDVGLAIAQTLDLDALGEEILLRALALLDARRGALYTLDGELFRLGARVGGSAREQFSADVDAEDAASETLPQARHLLAVPVRIETEIKGLLVVGDKESRTGVGPFSEDDRRRLEHLANQAALALEQARLHREALEKERLEREMELASQIQRGIIPRDLPDLTSYDLAGWTRPARHVGGDFYDVIPLSSGRFAIVLADVSGKGVPAALLVSTIHSLLRSLLDRVQDLDEVCRHLDRHLLEFSAASKYATLFLVDLDPQAGEIGYVNAGHNPALVLRADGSSEALSSSSFPVGLVGGGSYHPRQVVLEPGDVLCIYSDGLTEAESPRGEEYGLARLTADLVELRSAPLEEIRTEVERRISRYTAGQPQGDDQTVLLLRRR